MAFPDLAFPPSFSLLGIPYPLSPNLPTETELVFQPGSKPATVFLWTPVCVLSLLSCPTLCDLVDCSPPGSSVHRTLQARILEWVAMPPPGDLPHPGTEPTSLLAPALAGRRFAASTTWDTPELLCPFINSPLGQPRVWGCVVSLTVYKCILSRHSDLSLWSPRTYPMTAHRLSVNA